MPPQFANAYQPSSAESQQQPPTPKRPLWRRTLSSKWTVGILLLLLFLGVGYVGFTVLDDGGSGATEQASVAGSQNIALSIPLDSIPDSQSIALPDATLTVNGLLQINNGFTVGAETRPDAPQTGRIYLDSADNQLYLYNGTDYINLSEQQSAGVDSIGGIQGQISLGSGLTITGNTISSSGITTLQSGSSNLTIVNNGDGSFTISDSITSSGTSTLVNNLSGGVSIQGVANQTTVATDSGSSTIIVGAAQDINTTSAPAFGGLTVNGSQSITDALSVGSTLSVVGNTTLTGNLGLGNSGVISANNLSQTANGQDIAIDAGSDVITFTAGGREFVFPTSGPASQTICTTGISCASGGGQAVLLEPGSAQTDSSADVSIFINDTGGGNLLQLQSSGSDVFVVSAGGAVTAAGQATFNGSVNLGDATADALTFAGTIQGGSPFVFEGATANAFEMTFSIEDPTADRTVTFPDASGEVCLSSGNCVGVGGQAPNDAQYLTLALDGDLSDERVLNPGSNLTVTDNGANGNYDIDTVQDIQTTSTPTFGGITLNGTGLFNGNTTFGDAATDTVTFNGTIQGAAPFVFEGATADGFETSLVVVDPTADITYRLPDAAAGTYDICTTVNNCIGSGAAPDDAQYLVLSLDGDLSAERLLNPGANLTVTDNGANGNYDIDTIQDIQTTSNPTFGGITLNGAATLNANVTLGDAVADLLTFNGTIQGGSPFVFEGATANAFETTLAFTDPTADNTITFPDESGTVCTTGSVCSGYQASGNYFTQGGNNFGVTAVVGTNDTNSLELETNGITRLTLDTSGDATLTGDFAIQGGGVVIGTAAQQGTLVLFDGSSNTVTFSPASHGQNTILTIPDSGGATDTLCLQTLDNCAGAAGAPSDAQYLTLALDGDLSAERLLNPGSSLTVTDNGANGNYDINTVQDIRTTASPTFASIDTGNGAQEVNTIAGFLGDQNLRTTDTPTFGGITLNGVGLFNGNVAFGDAATDTITFNGTIQGGSPLVFEGSTADGFETTFTFTDPTADNTITFPDESGTVCTTGNVCSGYQASGNYFAQGGNSFGATAILGTNDGNDLAFETNGSTRLTIDTSGNSTLAGDSTIQGGAITLGGTAQAGMVVINDGSSNTGTIQTAALGQNSLFTLPDPGGVSDTVCLQSLDNCAGAAGAPTDAQYLVLSLDGDLSAERLLNPGSSLTVTDNGANGSYDINTVQDIRTTAAPTFAGGTFNGGVTVTGILNAANSLDGNQIGRLIIDYESSNNPTLVSQGGTIGFEGILQADSGASFETIASFASDFNFTHTRTTSNTHGWNFRGYDDAGSTIVTRLNIGGTDAAEIGLTVSGVSGQSASLLVLEQSGGADVLTVSSGGALALEGGISDISGDLNLNDNTNIIGALDVTGTTTLDGNVILGDASADLLTFNGTIQGASPFVFEGASADGFEITLAVEDPTADVTYRLPDASAGTYDLCTSAGNCLGGGGGGAPSSAQYLTLALDGNLSAERVLNPGSNLAVTDNGANGNYDIDTIQDIQTTSSPTFASPTFTGTLAVQGVSASVGTASTTTGSLVLYNSSSSFAGSLQVASLGQTTTYTLPDPGASTASICLSTGNCLGGSGGAPADAQYLVLSANGSLSAERILNPGNSISVTDNGANGNYDINTVQDIRTTASPTFATINTGNGAQEVNTIAGFLGDQDLQTTDSVTFGGLAVSGATALNGNTTIGDAATDTLTITSVLQGSLTFEGATADAFETTLTFTDPTADNTITFPDESGTVCTTGSVCSGYQASGNYFTQGGNSFGATATLGTNDSNDLVFETNGSTRLTISSSGNLGFGTAPIAQSVASFGGTAQTGLFGTILGSYGILNSASVDQAGIYSNPTVSPSGGGHQYFGIASAPNASGGDTGGAYLWGVSGIPNVNNSTLAGAGGLHSQVYNLGGGTVTNTWGAYINNPSNNGTITTNTGVYVADQTAGGTDYGVYIAGADDYALYVAGDPSYFGGAVTANTTLTVNGVATLNGNLTLGDAAADLLTFNGTIQGASPFVFEGSTADGFETTLAIEDPTADVTYTLAAESAGSYEICTSADNCAGDGGVTTVGTIDTQTKSSDGAVISGASIYLQTADATNVGLVSTGTQTFAGAKTFSGAVTASAVGTGLAVTNNATVGGILTVTGTGTFNGNLVVGDAGGDIVTVNSSTWTFANDTNFVLSGGVNGLSFDTSTLSIDANNNRVGVGTISPDSLFELSTESSTEADRQASFTVYSSTNNYDTPDFSFRRARGTEASPVVVNNGDILGYQAFRAYDGNSWEITSSIRGVANGAASDGSTPGALVFATTPSGSTTPVDRFYIQANGDIGADTNTLYVDATNNRVIVGDTSGSYPLHVTSGAIASGNSSTAGSLVVFDGSSNTVTLSPAAHGQNTVLTIPDAGGASDTLCLLTLANCTSSGVTTVGTIDTQTKSSDGAVISGASIYLQTADATNVGLVSTGTQTFAGAKTFTSALTVDGSADANQLVVQGHSTQTSPLIVAQASDSSELFRINSEDTTSLFFGYQAGQSDDGTNNFNTGIGQSALDAVTSGTYNTATGSGALGAVTDGNFNTAFGAQALTSTTGWYNTAIGMQAGYGNVGGYYDTSVGNQALYNKSTGSGNTALGYQAGYGNGGGDTDFEYNTFIGYRAGYVNQGNNNIAIGYQAGDNITTGGTNILLGNNIDAQSATGSNQLSIGNLIFGTGVDGTGTTVSTGSIGIGVASPTGRLQVAGDEVRIGDAGTVSSATGDGDLYVEDLLEVDGSLLLGDAVATDTLTIAATIQGASPLVFEGATADANELTIAVADVGQDSTITIPDPGGATDTFCLLSLANCAGASATLQSAYNAGNTITTTDNRDISFNLADTTTDSDFIVNLQADNSNFIVQDEGTTVFDIANRGVATFSTTLNNNVTFAVQNSSGTNVLQVDTASDAVQVGNGSASDPGLAFRGEPDSGWYVAGANTLGLSTGGTSRLTVDGNGHLNVDSNTFYVDAGSNEVGIGTNSPAHQLHLYRSGADATFLIQASTGVVDAYTQLWDGGSNFWSYGMDDSDSQAFVLSASGSLGTSNALRLDHGNLNATFGGDITVQGGDATIGTTSQTGSLVLSDGSSNTATLRPAAHGQNTVLTIPDAGGATDTLCLVTLANCGGGSGVTTVGTIDSQTKSSNGAVISGSSIYLQTADASSVGLVSTGTQTFAGAKTFSGNVLTNGNLTVGDAGGDTVTVNSSTWTFANDTNFALSGGVNGLSFDTDTLSIDATNNRVGIGTTTPGAQLELTGADGAALRLSNAGFASCESLATDADGDVICSDANTSSVTNYVTSDVSRTSTSTPTEVADLTFASGANEDWIIIVTGIMSSSSGVRFTVTAPSGSTCDYTLGEVDNASGEGATSCGTEVASSVSSLSYDTAILGGTVQVGGTPGNISINFAQASGNATPSYMRRGSSLVAFKVSGADLAEVYYSTDGALVPGTVVSFDPTVPTGVKRSIAPYSSLLAGVVSTDPGQVLGDTSSVKGVPVPLALSGRVPVRVTTENGEIKPGDFLTASATVPGAAMKATRSGYVIGRALTGTSGATEGVVIAFVNTQYADPSTDQALQVGDDTVQELKTEVQILKNQIQNNQFSDLNISGANIGTLKVTNAEVAMLTVTGNALVKGKLAVGGDFEVDGDIKLAGHLRTHGATPSVTSIADSTATIEGNDTSGTLTITTGAAGLPAGDVVSVAFNKQFDSKPQVLITAVDQNGAAVQDYVDAGTGGFTLRSLGAFNPGSTYTFNYLVVE